MEVMSGGLDIICSVKSDTLLHLLQGLKTIEFVMVLILELTLYRIQRSGVI